MMGSDSGGDQKMEHIHSIRLGLIYQGGLSTLLL